MVQTLFPFSKVSRTRNWLQHLSSVQDPMNNFIAIDRIKCRKVWLVYIAVTKSLEVENPEIWNYIMERNLSVQKSHILGAAIECDHAGEQVNRKDKTRGGLKSITRNLNSHDQHYLAAPLLAQLQEEIMNKGLVFLEFGESGLAG